MPRVKFLCRGLCWHFGRQSSPEPTLQQTRSSRRCVTKTVHLVASELRRKLQEVRRCAFRSFQMPYKKGPVTDETRMLLYHMDTSWCTTNWDIQKAFVCKVLPNCNNIGRFAEEFHDSGKNCRFKLLSKMSQEKQSISISRPLQRLNPKLKDKNRDECQRT